MDRGERDNWRMEIKDIRLQNLRILIARAGSITDLAERVGTDRNYVKQHGKAPPPTQADKPDSAKTRHDQRNSHQPIAGRTARLFFAFLS